LNFSTIRNIIVSEHFQTKHLAPHDFARPYDVIFSPLLRCRLGPTTTTSV
jgi:hypothetical protein